MTTHPSRLDRIFFALSDPTRRAIVGRLAEGSTTVGDLGAPFAISAPAISKHMRVLEEAGLINRRVVGRSHHCDLVPRALDEVQDWLDFYRGFWESRLDDLEEFLKQSTDSTEDDADESDERKSNK